MPHRVKELTDFLRRFGEIEVFEWDFRKAKKSEAEELQTDGPIKRLANLQVADWELKDVLPAIKKTANTEIDITSFLHRAAQTKVIEWDFRSILPSASTADSPQPTSEKPVEKRLEKSELLAATDRLRNFLQYVAVNLIDEPKHAQLKVTELGPNRLRFKLVLMKKDVAMLIGRNGFTASAIRGLLKAAAEAHGIHALLQIHSHEDEIALMAKEDAEMSQR
jgi:uncharacterized protein